MTDEIKGLPVSGYKATQPPTAIAAVNVFKEMEERALRHIDDLGRRGDESGEDHLSVDGRWLAIGRTQLQQAFMSLARSVFQPERIKLLEDMLGSESISEGIVPVPEKVDPSQVQAEVTAILRGAFRVSKYQDHRGPCLGGNIYGDSKGRFPDGTSVTTSTIISETDDVFLTKSGSIYKVESWAPEH